MSGKRKCYTVAPARLVIETGHPIAHVAKEIGVGEQLPGQGVAWVTARVQGNDGRTLDTDERAELERAPQRGRRSTLGP